MADDANKITYELSGEAIVRFVSTSAIPGPRGEKGEKGEKGDGASLTPGSGIAITGTTISVDGTIARTSDLASKADTSTVNAALAAKADSSTTTTALASKASTADLTTGLATKAAVNHTHDWTTITNRPTIAAINDALASSTSLYSASKIVSDLAAGLAGKANSTHTHAWSEITGKPTFATVALSGDYNDLINKPTESSGATINDAAASSTTTYSSSKIETIAAAKSNIGHKHVAADITGLGDGGAFKATFYKYDGGEIDLTASSFTPVPLDTVVTNNLGTWDSVNKTLTLTQSGSLFAVGTLRLKDGTTSGMSYGLGIHTANEDNTEFFWDATNAGGRQGVQAFRFGTFAAGDKIRLIYYISSGARIKSAAISIFPVSAALVAAMSGSSGSAINDSTSATTSTYSSSKIETLVTAINSSISGKASTSHTHSAADIVSGVLDAARLPTISYNILTDRPTLVQINDAVAAATTTYSGTKIEAIAAAKASSTDVQIFSASATWTKPQGAKKVDVILIGAGGGGGGGCKRASNVARIGGAGGGGGALTSWSFAGAMLPATVNITVGSPGASGAGAIASDANGNPGNAGGETRFGLLLCAGGGGGGLASTGSTANGGQGAAGMMAGAAGGSATATASSVGANPADVSLAAAGGGAGGGITASNVLIPPANGGAEAYSTTPSAGQFSDGTAGQSASGSTNAGDGLAPANRISGDYRGGYGGGGGGSASGTGRAGAGSGGGYPGGGGGGGGSATNAGGSAGSGGIGGVGLAVVITYF